MSNPEGAVYKSDDARIYNWPRLGSVGLNAAELQNRRGGIGGSDANVILSGDADRIRRLWQEKRGEIEPEDLSGILQVALGSWTEPFNRQWFERASEWRVSRVGEAVRCIDRSWRSCTLDGFIEESGAVWEAKHTGAFSKSEEVLDRYMPQLQHNMAVCKVERALLSVIFGNHKYEIFEVASDWIYQIELLEAETDFWDCVLTGRAPVPASRIAAPKPIGVREVCLDGNNAWAAAAADWLQCREDAKRHAKACVEIKSLIEPDVARAFGHCIEAKRSKSGAISIRERGE